VKLITAYELFPEIDIKKTKNKMESLLEKYQWMRLREPNIRQPKIVVSWSLTPPSATNGFHSDTESCAAHNVDERARRKAIIEKVEYAKSQLFPEEQELIIARYMAPSDWNDKMTYINLGMSASTYKRKKKIILVKMAVSLKMEEYQEVREYA
jgi:ArpU family phage transcriptional regulator